MTRRAAFLALSFITSLSMPIHADEENHHFTVALPAQWQHADEIQLVLEGVTVPGDQPFKLRVTTTTEDQQSLLLGSAGIVAAGRTKSGPRHLPALLIDVTPSTEAPHDSTRKGAKCDGYYSSSRPAKCSAGR